MVSTLKTPPVREMKPELIPDKRAAKPAFITAIARAGISPSVEQANITMIFEKPNFIPIGKGNAERISLSINDSASASAASMAVNVSVKIFLFFISVRYCIGSVVFCSGYLYNSFVRYTHSHVPRRSELAAVNTVFA